MSYTLLQLVDQVAGEMGLAVPSAVVGNSNAEVVQLFYLANGLGQALQREHQWQWITKENAFNSVYYTYTGDLTNGSTTISNLSSTTGLTTNPTYFQVTGSGVNTNTLLVSVDSGTSSAVMSQAATGTDTGVSLTFSQVKYSMPSDFDRQVDRTHWDKSQHWEMLGPETAQQWQWLKSGYISTGPRVRYRPLGNLFQIWPALGAEHLLGFEYVSNQWVVATGGTTASKTAFSVDSDTCVFPDRLMVLGLKLRYFEIKGFDTSALYRDYMAQLDIAKASDAGSPTLSMAPRPTSILIGFENIPDANYGA